LSAFIVENDTINRILSWLDIEVNSGNGLTSGRIRRELLPLGLDLSTKEGLGILGQAMYALNVRAVRARYDDADESGMIPAYGYQFEYVPATVFTALKSLHCWHYQCAEGTVPDDPLYKVLEEVSNAICHGIVRSLPAYEQAARG
jgi:hypothetical protein